MPAARPLPRKYLSYLEEVQEHLRLMAQKARLALTEIERGYGVQKQLPVLLRDIEAGAYRVALDLSEIQIASDCDECPAAPAATSAQIHLLVLAEELDRQAELARRHARGVPRAAAEGASVSERRETMNGHG